MSQAGGEGCNGLLQPQQQTPTSFRNASQAPAPPASPLRAQPHPPLFQAACKMPAHVAHACLLHRLQQAHGAAHVDVVIEQGVGHGLAHRPVWGLTEGRAVEVRG
jgi:hypothetical protein